MRLNTRPTPAAARLRTWSLRRQLLAGILLPVLVCIGLNLWWGYQSALQALHTAYDRSLLASAKTISEQLTVDGYDEHAHIQATVPYSALEAFEADTQTRMYYRVSHLNGSLISGFDDLPTWTGKIPMQPPYAALVDFYDSSFRGQPVRIAALLQPVASHTGRGMAVIQVAETLQLRHSPALDLLRGTLWQHAVLLGLIVGTVLLVVQRVTRPVRDVGHAIAQRSSNDLRPVPADSVARELQPLIGGMNHVMERLHSLLLHQKRFVRDASHQLRTPLAVLKVQVQSARRGDLPASEALQEIEATVNRATQLANQMLSLAKVEQLRQQDAPLTDWDAVVREVSLDLAPLIADKLLDFELQADQPLQVQAHDWMLRELVRNLLHNAIRHAPTGSSLLVELLPTTEGNQPHATLRITDQGPGLSSELQARLYEPFSAGDSRQGSGLGLAICQEIAQACHGTLALHNREVHGQVIGLTATVTLPLSTR